jgi:histidinol dehydrogenase
MMKVLAYPDSKTLERAMTRPALEQADLSKLVGEIMDAVRTDGDEAVLRYAKQFDNYHKSELFISEAEITAAIAQVPEDLKLAIEKAAANISLFHSAQKEDFGEVETTLGIKCWRKSVGIEKVGLYIPGGTAPLFSTVLMLGIPAKIAGCKEIVLATPEGKNGIHPAILFAADLIGITQILRIGGIQAIAALSTGTPSIPKVYKIFGPGNQYVTAAKQYAMQNGTAIDMPAGPSELMVVADESADSEFIAADLLSQAEHGTDSQVILLTTSERIAEETKKAVADQLAKLERKSIAKKSLEFGRIIILEKQAVIPAINAYGPEHLIICTQFNDQICANLINAGSVFIGNYTPESLGDYASGTNHTLPTNGYAKMYSGVSLDSFVRKITFQEASAVGLKNIGETVEIMAAAEQLDAHKNAVTIRLNKMKNEKL